MSASSLNGAANAHAYGTRSATKGESLVYRANTTAFIGFEPIEQLQLPVARSPLNRAYIYSWMYCFCRPKSNCLCANATSATASTVLGLLDGFVCVCMLFALSRALLRRLSFAECMHCPHPIWFKCTLLAVANTIAPTKRYTNAAIRSHSHTQPPTQTDVHWHRTHDKNIFYNNFSYVNTSTFSWCDS